MKEQTIKSDIEISGIGVHSGKQSKIVLKPSKKEGIIFIKNGEKIPATLDKVDFCDREITLIENGERIRTIEHLMSALYACKIDHVQISIEGEEIPALDGSAHPFVSAIEKAGIEKLKSEKKERYLRKNIIVERKGCFASCAPSEKLEIRYIISYNHPLLYYQEYSYNGKSGFKDIANCRTYGMLKWKEELNKKGFALGASEENTLVYTENGTLNKPRLADEAVRHKVLDLLGELYLMKPIPIGKYLIFRGGHLLHFQLLTEMQRSQNDI
jgi:UDP-3-O-[3-hydroxymyristoyl] N-acetylglucosamine deacetylase